MYYVLRFLPTASIDWGPHINGPQFTNRFAVTVRKFSVRKLHVRRSASPQVCILPTPTDPNMRFLHVASAVS